jgi:CO/xanthine dehydrogenase Mo-binding subunit
LIDLSEKVPRDLSELPLSQPRYLGKDTARVEDATLLTGRAEFGDNVAFPGMLFAAILRSHQTDRHFQGARTCWCGGDCHW